MSYYYQVTNIRLVKEFSDISTTMIVFTSLPFYLLCYVLLRFYNAGVRQKKVFGQDVFNIHGLKCTCLNIRIFFSENHDYCFESLIWKVYNDIKVCKLAKTIVVVNI